MEVRYAAGLGAFNFAAGAALSNLTTPTIISPAPQIVLPANYIQSVGKRFFCKGYGVFSTAAAAPGTLTLACVFGATPAVLAASAAITPTVSAANWLWEVEFLIQIRALGASGSAWTQGNLLLGTSATAWTPNPVPGAAPAAVTIDTTAASQIALRATWGTASASNSITCHDWSVVELN